MPLIPSDFPYLSPLFDETPPTSLAVTNAFTSVCNVFDRSTLHSLTSKKRPVMSEKILKTSQNGGSLRRALPPSDMLQILTLLTYIANG